MEIVQVNLKNGEVLVFPAGTWVSSLKGMGYFLDDVESAYNI